MHFIKTTWRLRWYDPEMAHPPVTSGYLLSLPTRRLASQARKPGEFAHNSLSARKGVKKRHQSVRGMHSTTAFLPASRPKCCEPPLGWPCIMSGNHRLDESWCVHLSPRRKEGLSLQINDAIQKAVVTFFLRFFFGLRSYGGKAAIRLANALCTVRCYSAFYAAIPAGYAA